MSVFGDLRDTGPGGNQEERKHVLTTAISVMLADGEETEVEAGILLDLGAVSPILKGMAADELQSIVRAVKNDILEHGHEKAIATSAAALSPALRETALCFAMLVTMADHEIEDGEVNSLMDLARALGMEPAEFDTFFKAMLAIRRQPES